MMLSGAAMSASTEASTNLYNKRPASPLGAELSMPPAKVPKTSIGQLQINYLKREKKETIPLATAEEPLPRLVRLISEYDGVLQRHESLAGNLGACPVGPILLKRFERLFEGPPRILKSNSRDPNITWLDVVEFAQNKPEQFDLEKTRNGVRVCQFYLKQCRVEISEEDYVLIRSGMPQKLIPPQPILEDEEKELGVIEVLDRNLAKVVQSADQVSARARQLVHRLKNRRAAILARREAEGDTLRSVLKSNDLPASPAFEHNGAVPLHHHPPIPKPAPLPPHSPSVPSSGFTAVNTRHSLTSSDPVSSQHAQREPHREFQREPLHLPEPILNGTPTQQPVHPYPHHLSDPKPTLSQPDDFMNRFLTPSERAAGMTPETIRRETFSSTHRSVSRETVPLVDDSTRFASMAVRRQDSRRESDPPQPEKQAISPIATPTAVVAAEAQGPSVPIPNTPASLMPQQKPHIWNRDDGGPYKVEMISRMETMKRGDRVIPPCDRCRRLHMDCIKNLTACLGCTKKHAKCSWKDVSLDEIETTAPAARERAEKESQAAAPSSSEWDNMLKHTKSHETEPGRESSTASGSVPPAETAEVTSNKASTLRVPTPPQNQTQNGNGNGNGNGTSMHASHPHESPRLNVRPPPLDQQLRDAAEDKPTPPSPFARFSPFQRPQSHQPLPPPPAKSDPMPDGGDRLAAIASQVYRSASQNANRGPEPGATEAAL